MPRRRSVHKGSFDDHFDGLVALFPAPLSEPLKTLRPLTLKPLLCLDLTNPLKPARAPASLNSVKPKAPVKRHARVKPHAGHSAALQDKIDLDTWLFEMAWQINPPT